MTGGSILLVGFLLGVKHATDADHVAAVATLASGRSTFAQSMKQGMAWGLGHAFTLMLFGGIVLARGKAIPVQLAQALELAVGVMLVALGCDVLRRLRARVRARVHSHRRAPHDLPANAPAPEDSHAGPPPRTARGQPPLRALAIGMMHGMAGSAALVLLSLQAVQSLPLGVAYIGLFGAGSIGGMALLSAAIAVPLRWTAGRAEPLHDAMTALIGGLTCALGAAIVYRIGVAQELLLG